MTALELFAAALAAWQAVEVWHHSDLFASWRARVELWRPGFWRSLLTCPFCTSVWVGLAAAGVLACPWPEADQPLPAAARVALGLARGCVWGLAVSRLANLGNDLTHAWCRTPRPDAAVPNNPL